MVGPDLRPQRLIVMHMSADVPARLDTFVCEYAGEGKVVEI